jgi:hypothetical protein
VASFQYLSNLNLIPPPFTIVDADANRDGIADLGEPRGFTILADSQHMLVTHHRSSFVSSLDITLDGNGVPTGIALAKKIDTNVYPFDPIYNPTLVQTIASQGLPRFLEDIAVSPDGTRALVPHVLHNINHDVNFNFGPSLAGDFANRVYPALTMIDTVAGSFGVPGDNSMRLHNELADPQQPAEFVPYGTPTPNRGGLAMLGATGEPCDRHLGDVRDRRPAERPARASLDRSCGRDPDGHPGHAIGQEALRPGGARGRGPRHVPDRERQHSRRRRDLLPGGVLQQPGPHRALLQRRQDVPGLPGRRRQQDGPPRRSALARRLQPERQRRADAQPRLGGPVPLPRQRPARCTSSRLPAAPQLRAARSAGHGDADGRRADGMVIEPDATTSNDDAACSS